MVSEFYPVTDVPPIAHRVDTPTRILGPCNEPCRVVSAFERRHAHGLDGMPLLRVRPSRVVPCRVESSRPYLWRIYLPPPPPLPPARPPARALNKPLLARVTDCLTMRVLPEFRCVCRTEPIKPINQPTALPTNELSNRPTNQPTEKSTNQSIDQPITDQCTSQASD